MDEFIELPCVATEDCETHAWIGPGECPTCVREWAEAVARVTVSQDTAYDQYRRRVLRASRLRGSRDSSRAYEGGELLR